MYSLKGIWTLGNILGELWADSASAQTTHLCPGSNVLLTCFLEGKTVIQGDLSGLQLPMAPVTFQSKSQELTTIDPGIWQDFLASSVLEILLSLFLLRSVGAPKEELSPAENLAIFGKESSPSSISVSVWKVPFQSNPLGYSNGLHVFARFYFQKNCWYLVIPIIWGETQLSLTWYFSE